MHVRRCAPPQPCCRHCTALTLQTLLHPPLCCPNWSREEEEIERLQEIERTRPVGVVVGPATVYRCKVRAQALEGSLGWAGLGWSQATGTLAGLAAPCLPFFPQQHPFWPTADCAQ